MTAFLLVAGLASPALAAPVTTADPFRSVLDGRGHYIHRGAHGEVDVNVCSETVAPGFAHCDAHVRTDLIGTGAEPGGVRHRPARSPPRTCSAQGVRTTRRILQSAYNAPSATNGAGQTVAIVDA